MTHDEPAEDVTGKRAEPERPKGPKPKRRLRSIVVGKRNRLPLDDADGDYLPPRTG